MKLRRKGSGIYAEDADAKQAELLKLKLVLNGMLEASVFEDHLSHLIHDSRFLLRLAQQPPSGTWRNWVLIGGRGSGKTRAGAEWVHDLASKPYNSSIRIALIAETLGDAREVMIDGVSGICRIARRNKPDFEPSRKRLVWPSGAMAQIFSSEDPESLRGPQFHYAWADEVGKWRHADETWDMLQFGLRLGDNPQQLVTSTPRPIALMKRLLADVDSVVVNMPTSDNADNLPASFLEVLNKRYGGTRLGRQEIDGELIEEREDSLWKRAMFEGSSSREFSEAFRIVVAVDPPAGSGPNSCCGIIVAGKLLDGKAIVLADYSITGASTANWARQVVYAFNKYSADRVVAEINQGGDMVSAMLKSVDTNLPLSLVRATRGKIARAEPIAALYEQGRVVHAEHFKELEDQMCDFGSNGLSQGRSPDRLDALVWGLTALMMERDSEPRVRGI